MATLISGTRTAEDIVREHLLKLQQAPIVDSSTANSASTPPKPPRKKKTTLASPAPIVAAPAHGSFITLHNLRCVNARGRVFEQYDSLDVAVDVARGANTYQNSTLKEHVSFTPYNAIHHYQQQQGMFLPSFALSCNILAALYAEKDRNTDAKAVLDQYQNYGAGYGWHAQNTLIDWKAKNIIHYPQDSDFPSDGGTHQVNQGKSKSFSFNTKGFADIPLEEALSKAEYCTFIRNVTGLEDPKILVNIGSYFGKPAKIWVPDIPAKVTYTSSAWLGCVITYFDLIAYSYLINDSAARGVRLVSPRSGAP